MEYVSELLKDLTPVICLGMFHEFPNFALVKLTKKFKNEPGFSE